MNNFQGVPRTHATANLHMTKERFGANDCIPTSPCQSEAGEWRTDYMNPKTKKTPQNKHKNIQSPPVNPINNPSFY